MAFTKMLAPGITHDALHVSAQPGLRPPCNESLTGSLLIHLQAPTLWVFSLLMDLLMDSSNNGSLVLGLKRGAAHI